MAPSPFVENGISTTQLTTLPLEIVMNILHHCLPPSLKQLRQSCMFLRDLASPILFDSIHIFPHMQHLAKILELSTCPSVRALVRHVTYDLRFAALARRIISRIESVFSTNVDAQQRDHALTRARDFEKQTLDAGRDNDIELLFLHDILRNLPSLDTISVLVEHASGLNLDDLPSFYQHLRAITCLTLPHTDLEPGEYSFAEDSRSAKQALVASHSLRQPIKHLEIIGGYWEHITAFEPEGKHLTMLKPLISGLHSLTLDNRLWEQPAPAFLMTNLGTVLNLAISLTELNLGFTTITDGIPFTEGGDFDEEPYASILELLDSTSLAGQKSNWGRKLQTLTLGGLRCRRHEFMRLLKRVSSTLQCLNLTDFTLVKNRDSESNSCLVSVMDDIRSATTLTNIYLHGNFTNSGAQEWFIESWRRPGRRRRREVVQDWILGRVDACPIDYMRIVPPTHDFTQKQFDAQSGDFDESWFVEEDYLRRGDGTDSEDSDDPGSDWGMDMPVLDDAGNAIPPSGISLAPGTEVLFPVPGLDASNTYDWLADDVD